MKLEVPEGEEADNIESIVSVGETSYKTNPTAITIGANEATTFYLRHGETLVLSNIPYGVTYTVDEVNTDGYEETVSGNESGTIKTEITNVAYTNNKNNESIDTGIYLDNLPYIIVFAGVLAAVAVLVIRRRRVDD